MVMTSNVGAVLSPGVNAGLRTGLWNIVSLAVALVIWQVAAVLVASPFFPTPMRIVDAFAQLATRGDTFGHSLWTHAWASVERVLEVIGEHHPELISAVIPDAGHWVMYEQPDAYNAALLEMLQSA